MQRTIAVQALRLLMVACAVAVVFSLVVGALGASLPAGELSILLPVAAAAIAVAGLPPLLRAIDRTLQLVSHDAGKTRYSALAETAARVRAGSLDQAMPGLARVLAEGTGAERAVVWLAVGDRLVSAACYPPVGEPPGQSVDGLAILLARPDTDHVVPVLDGPELRAVLAVSKPGHPFTNSDRTLMQDVANGAAMLLHGVALNAELAERVHRADELADELAASRERLTHAREVERRRLISELSNVTTDRMAALHDQFNEAADALSEEELADDPEFAAEAAQHTLRQARLALDELLERFRVIARGMYPQVLRDQGPFGALEEVATDLPRAVRLSGSLTERLAWEVESGIYYLAASAMSHLADRPAGQPLRVFLEHADGQLIVRIDDPAPPSTAEEIRNGLVDHIERLTAFGGDLAITQDAAGGVELRAWLPSELEPTVTGGGGFLGRGSPDSGLG
ncbi:MAG: sensor histidine kinase [Pseudonocardia sp.]